MAYLPRPDVTVEHDQPDGGHRIDVTIKREDRGRVYIGTGSTAREAVKGVVDAIIADPYAAEWLPGRKKDG